MLNSFYAGDDWEIQSTLSRGQDDEDLTSAVVTCRVVRDDCTLIEPVTCTLDDAADGGVSCVFAAAGTEVYPGPAALEFRATLANGHAVTYRHCPIMIKYSVGAAS